MDLNIVIISGRLTKDPENKNGKLTMFTVACNRMFGGEKKVTYFNCKAFGNLSEVIQKYCTKGMEVEVVGSSEISHYEDSEGNKKVAFSIIANEVNFKSKGSRVQGLQPESQDVAIDDDIPF